jgi:hypothetical protein
MPRATLTFKLPEETAEFNAARQGREAKLVLWEIDQRLRGLLKHGEPSKETAELANELRDMIRSSPENLLDD